MVWLCIWLLQQSGYCHSTMYTLPSCIYGNNIHRWVNLWEINYLGIGHSITFRWIFHCIVAITRLRQQSDAQHCDVSNINKYRLKRKSIQNKFVNIESRFMIYGTNQILFSSLSICVNKLNFDDSST